MKKSLVLVFFLIISLEVVVAVNVIDNENFVSKSVVNNVSNETVNIEKENKEINKVVKLNSKLKFEEFNLDRIEDYEGNYPINNVLGKVSYYIFSEDETLIVHITRYKTEESLIDEMIKALNEGVDIDYYEKRIYMKKEFI